MITLPEVDCSRGAPMGRPTLVGDDSESGSLTLQYIPLFEGYDEGGAYFGSGEPLILIHGTAGGEEVFLFERGSLEEVYDEALELYPYCMVDAAFRDNLIISGSLMLFGLAYADMREEAGSPMRGEILDQLPSPIDPAAVKLATEVVDDFLAANPGMTFDTLRQQHPQLDTLDLGHGLALNAAGHDSGALYGVPAHRPDKYYSWDYSMLEGTYIDDGDSDD